MMHGLVSSPPALRLLPSSSRMRAMESQNEKEREIERNENKTKRGREGEREREKAGAQKDTNRYKIKKAKQQHRVASSHIKQHMHADTYMFCYILLLSPLHENMSGFSQSNCESRRRMHTTVVEVWWMSGRLAFLYGYTDGIHVQSCTIMYWVVDLIIVSFYEKSSRKHRAYMCLWEVLLDTSSQISHMFWGMLSFWRRHDALDWGWDSFGESLFLQGRLCRLPTIIRQKDR